MFATVRKSLTVAVVAGLAAALAPAAVWAQAGYGGGGSRAYGGGNQAGGMTQSYGGGYGGQQGGYGGQQSGFGGGGGYGGQQSGFGAQGGGMMGGGGVGSTFGATSMAGGGTMGGGAAGGFGQQGGLNGQRNFIGRDAREVGSNFAGQFGQNQAGGQGRGRIQNFNQQRQQQSRWRDQRNPAPLIKVQLRPAFDMAPSATPAEVQTATQAQLDDVLVTHNLAPAGSMQVTMDRGVTVLTGVVATEHNRALIERLVSLEPGVGSIDNRLTVAATAGAPAPPSTP